MSKIVHYTKEITDFYINWCEFTTKNYIYSCYKCFMSKIDASESKSVSIIRVLNPEF
jgi:hypothetical protein